MNCYSVNSYRGGNPESLWSRLKVKGISGPGLNLALKTLPVEMTTWKEWKTRYPAADVLSQDTGHQRDYSVSPYQSYFASPELMFRVDHRDTRLPVKTRILGIWSENKQVAVPETVFAENDSDVEMTFTLDGLTFTVGYSHESNTMRIVDADSGLQWMYSFWFAWAAFHPQTDIQTLPSSFSHISVVMTSACPMNKSEQLAAIAENHESGAGVSAPAVPTHVADQRVIVMVRCLEAGKAKSRLIPALGPDGAANLHSCPCSTSEWTIASVVAESPTT